MHRVSDPASSHRKNRVAGLVRAFVNLKALAAKREHLRHERHAIELRIAVERPEYFVFTPNLDPVADPKF
jgi:hypothetical protein